MSNLPGLFVIGEANFSDHGANRLGASALMQGLADGYFIAPNCVGNYLATQKPIDYNLSHPTVLDDIHNAKNFFDKLINTKGKHSVDEILIHDETNLNQALIVANWTSHPVLPEPIGVIYCIAKPTYNQEMVNQIENARKVRGKSSVQDLLNACDTWTVN